MRILFFTLVLLLASSGGPTLDTLLDLMAAGEYARAEESAGQLLESAEAGGDLAAVPPILDVLVEARWRGGKATEPETRALGERGLALKRELLGPDDASVGKSLHHLAIVAYFNGELEEARSRWEEALRIRESALGSDHPDVAESANGLANLLQTTGEFEEAIALYTRAARIRERSFGPDDPRVGHTLNNLASLLVVTGRYAEALPVAERSLAIKEATFGEAHEEIGVGALALADILEATGQTRRAREETQRALEIWEKSLGHDHRKVAVAANNLAEFARREERWADAESLYRRALTILEKADDLEGVPAVLNNLAKVLGATHRIEEAIRLQQRSVELRQANLGTEHPGFAESLNGLGELLLRTGKTAAAREAYERCAAIRRTAFGDNHPDTAACIAGLARATAAEGDRRSAARMALDSERIARDHLRLTGRSLAEEHALRYAAKRDRGLDLALSLSVGGRPPDAAAREALFDALVRSRAVILDEIATRHRGLSSADPRIAGLARATADARTRLANLTVRGLDHLDAETYRTFVREAQEEKDRAERALAAASAEFARERHLGRVGSEEVRAALPDASALVGFVLYEHASLGNPPADPVLSYAALVQRAGRTEPTIVGLGAAAPLDRLIVSWKREVASGAPSLRRDAEQARTDYREAARALADALWKPLVPHLGEATRVFLVPDGAINMVSFAALPTKETRFLIEDGPLVHYLSAERDLASRAAPVSDGGLLAIGGPSYDDASPFAALAEASVPNATARENGTRQAGCGSFRDLTFSPLPGAREEIEEVGTIWEAAHPDRAQLLRLSGADATEGRLKRSLPGPRVLHIATHGFFLGGECGGGTSSRGLTIVSGESEPTAPRVQLSPLLRSGLALAGANHRSAASPLEEDGILTAEEVAALDLSGVEWAVLSACDTGIGEIQAGEGVSGLRRAMQVAGVRTLIMSLWPVDDEATRRWMTELYRGRFLEGLDSAAAVRHAGRAVLEARRETGDSDHPFYWAAFVAAGDWR